MVLRRRWDEFFCEPGFNVSPAVTNAAARNSEEGYFALTSPMPNCSLTETRELRDLCCCEKNFCLGHFMPPDPWSAPASPTREPTAAALAQRVRSSPAASKPEACSRDRRYGAGIAGPRANHPRGR